MQQLAKEFSDYSKRSDVPIEAVEKCVFPSDDTSVPVNPKTKEQIRSIYMRKHGDHWDRLNSQIEDVYQCYGCRIYFVEHDTKDGIMGVTKERGNSRHLCPPCCRLFIAHISQETVDLVLIDIQSAKSHRDDQENSKKRRVE